MTTGFVNLRTEILPATGRIVLGPSNFFFLLNSTATVDLAFYGAGTSSTATGVSGGYRKRAVQGWDRSVITGTPGVTVSYFTGTESVDTDDTDFRTQIATIAGITLIAESPSAALATPAPAVIADASALSIAANAARRRITLGSLSTNTGSVFIQATGAGAGRGIELQPGTFVEVKTTAAIDVRNDSGASQTITRLEET